MQRPQRCHADGQCGQDASGHPGNQSRNDAGNQTRIVEGSIEFARRHAQGRRQNDGAQDGGRHETQSTRHRIGQGHAARQADEGKPQNEGADANGINHQPERRYGHLRSPLAA